MRIALDVMGGDHGPAPVVAGALEAVQTNPNIILTLVGDRGQIEPLIQNLPEEISSRVGTHHASQVLTMEDHPLLGLRKKPDCSILRTWQLMAERKVEAIVSPGNTGAVVAAGLRLKKFLKYVRRPGIATVMPTMKGPCVMIDVGANAAPKATHLFQYGVMGSIYARKICNKEHPTIGLMNIGSESAKGHDLAKETYELFKASHLSDRFVGNIEGRDILLNKADVLVCEGFTGNVVLKLAESIYDIVKRRDIHDEHFDRFNFEQYGGVPVLGVAKPVIIGHGISHALAFKNMIRIASRMLEIDLMGKMKNSFLEQA